MKSVAMAVGLVAALALGAFAEPPEPVVLVAGQHYDAGWVTTLAEFGVLTVLITTENGWVLEETHVYVGTEPPTKSAPGRFPYKHEFLDGAEDDMYEIDLAPYGAICGTDLYVAVHAVVVGKENEYGKETAWGEGFYIRAGKNWAMYFTTPVRCE